MLPLSLLNVATGSPLLVELKGGDTYNGRLVSCDSWMNMNLREVICTSKDGDRFWKLPSCYIRGSAIKYLRLPPDLLEKAKAEGAEDDRRSAGGRGGGRGGYTPGARGGRSGTGGRTGGGRGRGREGGRGRSGGRGPGRGSGDGASSGAGRGGGRGRGRGREGENSNS